jgi:hypothetical protein
MKLKYLVVVATLLTFVVQDVNAKDIPVQARLFLGATSVEPEDLNTELTAEGLEEVDTVAQMGVEILYPVVKVLDVGLRYTKRGLLREEVANPSATDYQADIVQDSVQAVARIPFFRTAIIRADAFAGFGGTNTTLELKTASQEGTLERKDSASWFADTVSSYGASFAIGYKKFYLVFEGGIENNKVDGFKRTGTVNTNIDVIDLSGSYVTVGILFNGANVSRK